ncbi:MAG: hypothetical protein NW217_13385 [Hyphomicrobiaceae bacterium]|nr:hypothetical protein [Hyphomicrobiaceae bacterium]
MAGSFHETFAADAVAPPSPRSTGLVFCVVALIVAYFWRASPTVLTVALVCAASLLAVSLLWPRLLQPLNIAWFRLGLVMHKFMNPLIMLLIFVIVFVPAGLLMRVVHDPLRRKRGGPGQSYWISQDASGATPSSMTNQF